MRIHDSWIIKMLSRLFSNCNEEKEDVNIFMASLASLEFNIVQCPNMPTGLDFSTGNHVSLHFNFNIDFKNFSDTFKCQ
jgi:hypothetical protein